MEDCIGAQYSYDSGCHCAHKVASNRGVVFFPSWRVTIAHIVQGAFPAAASK